jgi:hypothetical protein
VITVDEEVTTTGKFSIDDEIKRKDVIYHLQNHKGKKLPEFRLEPSA